jgi:hypothetical protein
MLRLLSSHPRSLLIPLHLVTSIPRSDNATAATTTNYHQLLVLVLAATGLHSLPHFLPCTRTHCTNYRRCMLALQAPLRARRRRTPLNVNIPRAQPWRAAYEQAW